MMGGPTEVEDAVRLRAVARTGLADPAPDVTFDELAHAAASLLDAPHAFFTIVDAEHSWFKGAAGLPEGADRCTAVDDSFCRHVISSDRAVIVDDARTDPRIDGQPVLDGHEVVAWAGFPVRDDDGNVLGTFCVVDRVPRQWTAPQLEALGVMAQSAADQVKLRSALRSERKARANAESAWLEAEAARLQLEAARRREHEVVNLIQRSLLPSRLPEVPGLETAVRFDASNDAADIGGDWYDVIRLGGEDAALVIGDVCGHDVGAVAVMAQVRHYLHVVALRQADPVAALAELDGLMLEQDFDRFATVGYLVWHDAGGRIRYVSAGHPPPLVVRPDGTTELLEDGRRPPVNIGLAAPADLRPGEARLGPGDVLVLYTDGLFEAWGPDPDVGLDRLRRVAAAQAPGTGAEAWADALLAGMRPEAGWSDDVAIVVARRS